MISSQPVLASLIPVFFLIGLGYMAGRLRWIRDGAVEDLSNLVFLLLIPALLFRTMSAVHVQTLDVRPLVAYFLAAGGLLSVGIAWRGFNRRSVVLAFSGVFSNMVMIGITLVELAYGQQGLVTLLTLVSVHALILLTGATVVLELVVAREVHRKATDNPLPHLMATTRSVLRSALIHPVPLPIIGGLLFAQTGWVLPAVIDKPLQLLGSAFGPLALVLLGITLAHTPMKGHLQTAMWSTLSKNLVLPVLVGLSARAYGISGLPLTVLVVTAALPTGANAFLFAQRYQVEQASTTASIGVSTVLALITLSLVMFVMSLIN
jgi:malonate transporter